LSVSSLSEAPIVSPKNKTFFLQFENSIFYVKSSLVNLEAQKPIKIDNFDFFKNYYTVHSTSWKIKIFSATQIFREIKFGQIQSVKYGHFDNFRSIEIRF